MRLLFEYAIVFTVVYLGLIAICALVSFAP